MWTDRHSDGERATGAGTGTRRLDRSTVQVDDRAHERETDPEAFRGCAVSASEGVEDVRKVGGGDALSRVFDRNHETRPIDDHADADASTVGRVAYCIREQV